MHRLRPRRRATTHVETLRGELCIYEWTTKTVHALNPAAARVWGMCDGVTTIEEMRAALRHDRHASGATSIVAHALAQFDRAGLLEPGTLIDVRPLVSRRALLRRIGVAAAIPVVTSIVAPTPLAAQSGNTRQFDFTGTPQTFNVPPGITSLQVNVLAASGGGTPAEMAGSGGRVQAILPVTPLEVLTIVVGGSGSTAVAGGFNGGGNGGTGITGGLGGGGASDIRRGSTRLIVAGGGGGMGQLLYGVGGRGGGLVGDAGVGSGGGGGGGTQSAGGAAGTGDAGGTAGSPGTSGTGGAGAPPTPPFTIGGGGGGGGYFGGGGGGSSFADPPATSVVHTQNGAGSGNLGQIILSW